MNKTTYKILNRIKVYLECCLNELNEEELANDFICGEKTAYVECLELLQSVGKPHSLGLDYDIEERYPISSKS